MKTITWYDFGRLSQESKKKFLLRIKPAAEKNGRFDLFLYNRYAEEFGLNKIRDGFY